MILFQPKHFFEAKYPMLEDDEEEVFFEHPYWPGVKCNQVGAVYFDESLYMQTFAYNYPAFKTLASPTKNVGSKAIVIYECYHGGKHTGKQVYHINGNIYDYTYDNLILTCDYKHPRIEEAKTNKRKFIGKSIEHLMKLEAKFEKEGMQKEQLHKILMLPLWLLNARKNYRDGKVRYNWSKDRKKSEET